MAKGFRFPEYRYFYEVANSRSMRKAADVLHISPSALSRQIRKIEYLLGSQLIERGRSGIRLTISGEYALQHIKESFAAEERLLAKLNEIAGLRLGHVRVACGDGFLPDLLGDSFERFARKHPGITFEIKSTSRDYIIKSVIEEEAELGFIFYPQPDQRLRTLAHSRQPLHVVMSPNHALARKKLLSLQEVSAFPLALLVPSHGVRQAIDVEARRARVELRARFTCNSITALRAFAERFDVLTILPKFAAIPELTTGRLVAVPLSGKFFNSTEANLFAKRTRDLTLPTKELARVLIEGMQALSSAA
jgi:DNA-binding transcriptional LysR family regulator